MVAKMISRFTFRLYYFGGALDNGRKLEDGELVSQKLDAFRVDLVSTKGRVRQRGQPGV